ncbi:hypothetical protein C8K44_12168 [Aminobacter sp. AP02]|nr:hypothetical protein C8K44_12168 [Aminobacter sp. AP02]
MPRNWIPPRLFAAFRNREQSDTWRSRGNRHGYISLNVVNKLLTKLKKLRRCVTAAAAKSARFPLRRVGAIVIAFT